MRSPCSPLNVWKWVVCPVRLLRELAPRHPRGDFLAAGQMLRINPVLYWLPLARWATERNFARVIRDVGRRAERREG